MTKYYHRDSSIPRRNGKSDPGTHDVLDRRYSVQEIANIWGISKNAAWKRIKREAIPTHKPDSGRGMQILHSEWIAHIRKMPGNEPGIVY